MSKKDKPMLIGKVLPNGTLEVQSLVEWAKSFNDSHRIPVAKEARR